MTSPDGEIVDVLSAGEAEQPQPSTGAVNCGHSMIVRNVSNTTAIVTHTEWAAVENLTDEARMLFHNFADSVKSRKITMPTPDISISRTSVGEATSNLTTAQDDLLEETAEPSLLGKIISKVKALSSHEYLLTRKYLYLST